MASDIPDAPVAAQAAHMLHQDLIPGTEVMRDTDDIHLARGPHSGAVLVPHPSNDPKDPLNWSTPWKYLVITTQFLFLFVSVESALSMGPIFPLFSKEFDIAPTQQSLLTGVCVLALGFSNFLIVPCSNIFGRRVTSLAFCLLGVGTCIWQALAKSYSSLLAARVVNGVATATSETLLVQVVSDMLFLHERGMWTGVYFMGYFLGLFVGPIISGNIGERYGWRSFFWLSLAMTCFNLITLFFCFPETMFRRGAQIEPAIPENKHQPTKENPDGGNGDAEFGQIEHIDGGTTIVGSGRPSKTQFKLWQTPDPRWKAFMFRDIVAPAYVFFFPIILWAGLNVAGPANLLLYWNLTESPVLSGPPYNFTPSAVGYSNFAFVVGGIVGLVTAGPLSDWIAAKATARNNGIREAEMRLPALIPYFVTTVIGIVVGGLGYQHGWRWPIILVIGYGLSGLCVAAVPTIAIAYAVDCYKPLSGEIMVVATVIKNTCGFAMSYWVDPLAASKGWVTPTMAEFSLTIGPMLLGIPMYFFGKNLRRLTRNSAVHSYEA